LLSASMSVLLQFLHRLATATRGLIRSLAAAEKVLLASDGDDLDVTAAMQLHERRMLG
jgi:hypothetical protein